MIIRSNCKINIGLNIVRKRSDGYHDIESIFYPVTELYDTVEIVKSDSKSPTEISYSESGLVVDCPVEKNLCVKAARLMQQQYNIGAVAIHLHKRVPFGAGLGGGSSNATHILLAINTIFNLNLEEQTLMDLAAQLGSDTPFFVRNRAQLSEGRGEILSPVDLNLSDKYIVLIKPEVAISTAEAYSGVSPKIPQRSLRELNLDNISQWRDIAVNDFETHLFKSYPELATIKAELYSQGAIYASMSGSGSTIYGIFNEKPNWTTPNPQLFVFQGKL